jgi:MFS transporter, NNP family, nitrate/nitrite transporter
MNIGTEPAPPPSGWPRAAALTLPLAMLGLALNLRAWILLSPRLSQRTDVDLREYVLLMALPLLVAAVVRLPVGVLTDRYGPRVTFPAVSLLAAVSVAALGLSGSLLGIVVAGTAAGIAGSAYVVGAALVASTVGYGARGRALGVYTLGSAVAAVISVVSWAADPGGRRAALVLAAALAGYAALAALLLPTPAATGAVGTVLGRCLQMLRVASSTSLTVLYALALGGVMAIAVYLPAYLTGGFGLPWLHALGVTGVVVLLSAGARLIGGWWTDRRPTAGLLLVCYATAAALCAVLAVAPRWWGLSAPLVAGVAVCDGLASGALLTLIAKAAPREAVGAIIGITGAAAMVGTVAVSMLLASVDWLSHSYAAAWILLAGVLAAVAGYVRSHGLRIGLGLAVPAPPQRTPTAMTVAVVDEADTRWGAAALVARLADLAARDELVVVYGTDLPPAERTGNALVVGLRDRLPRYRIVPISLLPHSDGLSADAALVGDLVESGAVAIAVTPHEELAGITARLSTYLHADRILKASYSLAEGADLHPVWDRPPTP